MSLEERNHWIEAAKEKVIFDEGKTNKAVDDIMFLYDETAFEIENRINALFTKYATDNKLSSSEANRLISGKEYSVWKKSIDDYVAKVAEEAADSKTLLELNTLAMKSRISREEQLLADVYRHMAELANDTSTDLTALLGDITRTSYYRSCFNIQKGIGACFEVGKISDRVIDNILKYPWAKKKFSKTVWDNVDTISALTKRVITRGFISGSGCQKMVKEIDDVMGKGKDAAERVVRTECKYFANQGELQGYKENGITQYVFMGGTEGSIGCECADYNGQVIDVDKAEAGVNFPPMHPNCLCTVRAHFEKSVFEDRLGTVPLKDNLKYKEWKDKYIDH
ncbi:MAG: minor capsid protein, partial [Oscillospiraceae bacterium]